jgi:hypothetical protein
MVIPWGDLRVCSAWLTCLVKIAQAGSRGRFPVEAGEEQNYCIAAKTSSSSTVAKVVAWSDVP